MKDLSEIRVEIDAIDRQIIELYENRMILAAQVADYKISTGKAVFDAVREKQKLDAVAAMAHTEFTSRGARDLFEHIMSISRKKQYQLLTEHGKDADTGFLQVEDIELAGKKLGVIAATEEIVKTELPEVAETTVFSSVIEVFQELKQGTVDYALLPCIYQDSVSATYNLIAEHDCYIIKELEEQYVLVSTQKVTVANAQKLTICFEAPDVCGSLNHLLSHIAYNNLNMNRIESVPIAKDPLDYRFFMNLTGNLKDSPVKNTILGLSSEATNFRILGNY